MDEVKKEMRIRKKILDIYNKTQDDYSSKQDYDEYLEEVEDTIYNLVYGIDVEATERKVLAYERENADLILQNHAKRADEARRKAAAAAAESHFQGPSTSTDPEINMEDAPTTTAAQIKPEPGMMYTPASVMSGVVNIQPVALQEVQLDKDGFIIKPQVGPPRITLLQQRAGGWSSEIYRRRNMEEAFTQLFII